MSGMRSWGQSAPIIGVYRLDHAWGKTQTLMPDVDSRADRKAIADTAVREALSTMTWSAPSERAYREEDLIGKTLAGRYRLERILGQGGMGAVFEAVDLQTQDSVAVKLILIQELMNKSTRLRFEQEAKAARGVQDDYVVRLLDSGSDGKLGTPFIVMELLHGEDLSDALDRVGAMDPRTVAKIGIHVCRGLHAAHEQKIIHRDIKPANIFLTESRDGEILAKICDFGIAKHGGPDDALRSAALTLTGSLLGTPTYSAPEQAMNPKEVDGRSDVWSLCLALYKAISARRIWPRVETIPQLFVWICTHDVRPLLKVAPWVEPELAAIIHRGIHRDPAKRWDDVKQLEVALLEWLGQDATIKSDELRPVDATRREAAISQAPEVADEEVGGTLVFAATEASAPIVASEEPHRGFGRSAGWVLGLLLLGGGAAVYRAVSARADGRETAALATNSAHSSSTLAASASANATAKTVEASVKASVRIAPPGARVSVGGSPRETKEGVLLIEGRPGESFHVEVRSGNRTLARDVVLLRDGTTKPAELKIEPSPGARSQPRATLKSAPTSLPAPVVTAAPAPPARSANSDWKLRGDWSD